MREKNRNSPATLVTVGKTSFRPSGSCFFFLLSTFAVSNKKEDSLDPSVVCGLTRPRLITRPPLRKLVVVVVVVALLFH